MSEEPDPEAAEPVELPLDGTLDLHAFRPADAGEAVRHYLAACRAASVLEVRIVHGKGQGVLRRIVRSALAEMDYVVAVREGGSGGGDWGATLVDLAPPRKE